MRERERGKREKLKNINRSVSESDTSYSNSLYIKHTVRDTASVDARMDVLLLPSWDLKMLR